ncbi:MAG: 30S ribosome-binding factor RbfA [Candidatus Omnitrophica bacterium]|nr:30S ribosome-binding factor RbfA [Candidatus Omnitrophota bacterium]
MSRMDRLNQLFKREISNMILMGDIVDPRIKGVTITYADVSKDLSWAHIGFSVLSDDPNDIESAKDGLASACGRIRFILGERVVVRYMPKLKFVYDKTITDSFKMTKTFEDMNKEKNSSQEDLKDGE